MQAVLDAPVPADGLGQDGRIVVATGEEIADLSLGLAGAVDIGYGAHGFSKKPNDRSHGHIRGQGSRLGVHRSSPATGSDPRSEPASMT